MSPPERHSPLFPYTTLFRSLDPFDEALFDCLPQGIAADDVGKILILDVAGARRAHHDAESVLRAEQKLLPTLSGCAGFVGDVMRFVIQDRHAVPRPLP